MTVDMAHRVPLECFIHGSSVFVGLDCKKAVSYQPFADFYERSLLVV